MSTFGIKKGGRRFKPKPSDTPRVRKRLRKDNETNEEQQQTPHPVQQQQEQTEQVVKEIYQDTHDSFIYDNDTFESTIPTQMELAHSSSSPASSEPSPSRLPIVPLSQDLIYSTLLDYTSNKKKRKRVHGPSKEQLILMAEKEQEEKERQKVKQKEVANKNRIVNTIPVPQVKMKNGEIVVDETTLRATSKLVQETEQETEEEMEEELDKQVVDEGSFIRMQRGSNPQLSKRWTFEETELFYDLLKELGLNFTAISARIPGRTREQIRKKYFKEYKSYPLKIDKLLQN